MLTFELRALHQIEMTSNCNLRCRYCPSPHLQRPKLHMSDEHYTKSLKWATYFVRTHKQRELNLAGIGESTIHPEFVRNVHLAREAVGDSCDLVLATNGVVVTDELARAIAPARPRVWVSNHRPEKSGPAINALRRAGVLAGTSNDPAEHAINWAGQVKWEVSVAGKRHCQWVTSGRCMVMADGRLTRCCLDASGSGVLGTIDDDLTKIRTSPYVLCKTCDEDVGVPV